MKNAHPKRSLVSAGKKKLITGYSKTLLGWVIHGNLDKQYLLFKDEHSLSKVMNTY